MWGHIQPILHGHLATSLELNPHSPCASVSPFATHPLATSWCHPGAGSSRDPPGGLGTLTAHW